MSVKRRKCTKCGKNRALKFYTPQGRICASCRKTTSRKLARSTHLQQTYNITHDEYESILAAQGGTCAICKGVRTGSYDVDHDHKEEKRLIATGVEQPLARRASIRGLLCKRCNRRLLPASLDSVTILESAIAYITDPPATNLL